MKEKNAHVKFTDKGLVCPKSLLDIRRTLACGQMFRYYPQSDGSYEMASGDKLCKLYYDGDETVIETAHPDYFYDYFDFDTDYDGIVKTLSAFDELRPALSVSGGLRILRQDKFETAVSFIISANNNIKRIQGIIERICARLGGGARPPMPTREKLMTLSEEDYRALGCGFRSGYLYRTVPLLTREYLDGIGKMSHADAKKELCGLCGVGPKVAECILLFAYKMTDSYPVDTWIFKANRSDELDTPDKVCRFYSERYGSHAGYAQQYIFEYMRNAK